MRLRPLFFLASLVLLLAACGGAETATDEEASPAPLETELEATEPETGTELETETEEPTTGAATLTTADSELGEILVGGAGRTLYVFMNDTGQESTCYDDCEANWPPLTGEVAVEGNVDDSLLSTTEREDGSTQVVYNDHPLYYFAGDQAPGDTNGQSLNDVWFVVDPSGEPVQDASASLDRDY